VAQPVPYKAERGGRFLTGREEKGEQEKKLSHLPTENASRRIRLRGAVPWRSFCDAIQAFRQTETTKRGGAKVGGKGKGKPQDFKDRRGIEVSTLAPQSLGASQAGV